MPASNLGSEQPYTEPPPAYTNEALDAESAAAAAAEATVDPGVAFGGPVAMMAPPSYQVAAELPTYDEAEATKEGKPLPPRPDSHGQVLPPGAAPSVLPGFIPITITSETAQTSNSSSDGDDIALLGNDFIFFTAFVAAFLFNWVGFLLMMCFCHTIAARYGALSGFGLSLTKWTLIVKRSADFQALGHHRGGMETSNADVTGGSGETAWLWWLIMAFGLLICIRALLQYLAIKRTWQGLSTAARERLFFFY